MAKATVDPGLPGAIGYLANQRQGSDDWQDDPWHAWFEGPPDNEWDWIPDHWQEASDDAWSWSADDEQQQHSEAEEWPAEPEHGLHAHASDTTTASTETPADQWASSSSSTAWNDDLDTYFGKGRPKGKRKGG